MGIISEFKTFAIRGNVADMAVGIIMGSAFGKIVSSIVSDIIMPPIGLIISGVKFTDLKIVLKEATKTATGEMIPAVTLNYGNFIQTAFDFIVIAFSIFLLVKGLNHFHKKKEIKPAPSKEELLLTEIRDLLKEKQ